MKKNNELEISKKEELIFDNIYLADKIVQKTLPISQNEFYKDYIIGNQTIIRIPNQKQIKKFWILSPQIVDNEEKSIEAIEVNQRKASMTFIIYRETKTSSLMMVTFDSLACTWDVRYNLEMQNIPSNLNHSLQLLQNKKFDGVDGLLYSETFRTMIDDVNHLYEKKSKNTYEK